MKFDLKKHWEIVKLREEQKLVSQLNRLALLVGTIVLVMVCAYALRR